MIPQKAPAKIAKSEANAELFTQLCRCFADFDTDSFANFSFVCQNRSVSSNRAKQPIDAISKQIVEQLQLDGRKSYAEIAKVVGLSEAAVRQRVQKLTESGIAQIVAVTDPLSLGFNRLAMIGVRVSGDIRKVADELAEMPEVSYLIMTAGSFDLMFEVVCEDDEALIEMLNSRIRAVSGVISTETFMYLNIQKQKYDWGTR